MTVGNLFLIVMSIEALILIASYIVYICTLKNLKKKGYKYPEEKVFFSTIAFLTHITSLGIGVAIFLIYKIITNWNVVI